jgi:hypothetical protein
VIVYRKYAWPCRNDFAAAGGYRRLYPVDRWLPDQPGKLGLGQRQLEILGLQREKKKKLLGWPKRCKLAHAF